MRPLPIHSVQLACSLLGAQLRSHARAHPGTITRVDDNGFAFQFDEPTGVTPGQMCVLYDGDEVRGAGTIE